MALPARMRAVVTGAGSGLGRAFCLELSRRGARILASDIDMEAVQATASLCKAEIHTVRCDVSWREEVRALGEAADRLLGGTDLLINNAGVAAAGLVGEIALEDWDWLMGINLWGVIYGCHEFVPRFRAQGAGHVLNVASAAGLLAAPNMGPYNVSKAGVVALSETLAGELAGTQVGVTVLCPTFFPTSIHTSARGSAPNLQAEVGALMARSKLSAEDVARIALDGAAAGKLYVLPHGDGRLFWRIKRASPEGYRHLLPRLLALGRKHLRQKQPRPA